MLWLCELRAILPCFLSFARCTDSHCLCITHAPNAPVVLCTCHVLSRTCTCPPRRQIPVRNRREQKDCVSLRCRHVLWLHELSSAYRLNCLHSPRLRSPTLNSKKRVCIAGMPLVLVSRWCAQSGAEKKSNLRIQSNERSHNEQT